MRVKNLSTAQPVTLHLDGQNLRIMPRQVVEVPDKLVKKNKQVQNLKTQGILKVTK